MQGPKEKDEVEKLDIVQKILAILWCIGMLAIAVSAIVCYCIYML